MVVRYRYILLHYITRGDTKLDVSNVSKSYSATAHNTQSLSPQCITEPLAPHLSPLPYLPTPHHHQVLYYPLLPIRHPPHH